MKVGGAMSLQEMAVRALQRGPDYPAFEWRGRWWSWDELRQTADEIGRLIKASGADPHAKFAVLPRSQPGVIAGLVWLIAQGRSVCMIHTYQSPAGVARDLAKLKPAAVIGSVKDLGEEVQASLREAGIAGIVLDAMQASAAPDCERSTVDATPAPAEPQIELLTSGTTGPPKHFPMSFDMLAKWMVGVNVMKMEEQPDPYAVPPLYVYVPFSNITGLYFILPAMAHGIRGVLLDRHNLANLRDYVRRFKPSYLGLPVPAIREILDAEIPPEELASVKGVGTGTAPLDVNLQRAFQRRYGIPILLGYGATEFGGPVSLMQQEDWEKWGEAKTGSAGRAWSGAELRVVDQETGAVLPPGQEGLLEVRTPRFPPEHGWIRSSDLVVIDEDGFLWHRGRADGAIMRGGFKLLPVDIERALSLHSSVSAALVIGLDDRRLGQVPGAAIQLKPGAPRPSITELEAHLRQHVASTQIPTVWRFVDVLPYTTMMKPDRPALKRLFEEAQADTAPG
jgi:acyl-coenzyme A synthetase/AMP-(fatty) acid ligase